MKSKSIQRIGLISGNAVRQILASVYQVAVPIFVLYISSDEIWGAFVPYMLFVLFALQIVNWGNKEYLLRTYSELPKNILTEYGRNLATRFPLLLVSGVVALYCFPGLAGLLMLPWLLGRYLSHGTEALVVYETRFGASNLIETASFILFAAGLVFNQTNSVLALLALYSGYQFVRGLAYAALFKVENLQPEWLYYKKALPFFLLCLLGFFASKGDVYIVAYFADAKATAHYQIINSMLVFIMSVSAFVYVPFVKNIYRNNTVTEKAGRLMWIAGLVIIPPALVIFWLVVKYYLLLDFTLLFYLIAFAYIFPSFAYGITIISLFKEKKESKVLYCLTAGVLINFGLSTAFLYLGYGISGVLGGSAISQWLVFAMLSNLPRRLNRKFNFYANLIHKGDLCFDIGANIGKKSELFLKLGAKVIAFEPQSACHEKLASLKEKYSNFDFYPFAVGAENGQAGLQLANESEVATLSDDFVAYYTSDKVKWHDKEIVKVQTLEALIDSFGIPKYCKIDTEGYELHILSGLTSRIRVIEFEFTGGFIADTLKIIDVLDGEGVTFNYIRNEHLKFRSKKWLDGKQMKAVIRALDRHNLHGNIFVRHEQA